MGFTRPKADSGYADDLLPWILVLADRLGLLFIQLTLTATARINTDDPEPRPLRSTVVGATASTKRAHAANHPLPRRCDRAYRLRWQELAYHACPGGGRGS